MNLDELQSVQSKERQASDLQHLRPSFYADAAEFIRDLREQRQRVVREEGLDAAAFERLTDDIKTAERAVESIYERRVGKVVKKASIAAADMPTDDEGLTDEERDLFDTLVADIRANREAVLSALDADADDAGTGTTDPSAPADPPDDPGPEQAGADGVDAADLMGGDGPTGDSPPDPVAGRDSGGAEPADPPPSPAPEPDPAGAAGTATDDGGPATGDGEPAGEDSSDVDRATVRITRDVGEIFGVDQRAYHLASEDVVTLPEANAEPLVERGAAERIE